MDKRTQLQGSGAHTTHQDGVDDKSELPLKMEELQAKLALSANRASVAPRRGKTYVLQVTESDDEADVDSVRGSYLSMATSSPSSSQASSRRQSLSQQQQKQQKSKRTPTSHLASMHQGQKQRSSRTTSVSSAHTGRCAHSASGPHGRVNRQASQASIASLTARTDSVPSTPTSTGPDSGLYRHQQPFFGDAMRGESNISLLLMRQTKPLVQHVRKCLSYLARSSESSEAQRHVQTFLHWRTLFVPSDEELLQELMRVYHQEDDDASMRGQESRQLQQSVCRFLQHWWVHRESMSPKVRQQIQRFELLTKTDKALATKFTHITDITIPENFTHLNAGSSTGHPLNISAATTFSHLVLDLSVKDLADHLTALDAEVYQSITAADIIQEVVQGGASSVWKIRLFTIKLGRWVTATIVHQQQTKVRADVLSKWLQVSRALRTQRSFSCLFGLVLAMNSKAITRLIKTFSCLSEDLLQELILLRQLKPQREGGRALYADMLDKAEEQCKECPTQFCVPFIGHALHDMTSSYEEYLAIASATNESDKDGMFEKLQEVYVHAERYLQFQQRRLRVQLCQDTLAYLGLAHRIEWSTQLLMSLSYQAEPAMQESARSLLDAPRKRLKVACCGSENPMQFAKWIRETTQPALLTSFKNAGLRVPSRTDSLEDVELTISHLVSCLFSRYAPGHKSLIPSIYCVLQQAHPLLPHFEDIDEACKGAISRSLLSSYLKEIVLFSRLRCMPHLFHRTQLAPSTPIVCRHCKDLIPRWCYRCTDCHLIVHGKCRLFVHRNCVPACDGDDAHSKQVMAKEVAESQKEAERKLLETDYRASYLVATSSGCVSVEGDVLGEIDVDAVEAFDASHSPRKPKKGPTQTSLDSAVEHSPIAVSGEGKGDSEDDVDDVDDDVEDAFFSTAAGSRRGSLFAGVSGDLCTTAADLALQQVTLASPVRKSSLASGITADDLARLQNSYTTSPLPHHEYYYNNVCMQAKPTSRSTRDSSKGSGTQLVVPKSPGSPTRTSSSMTMTNAPITDASHLKKQVVHTAATPPIPMQSATEATKQAVKALQMPPNSLQAASFTKASSKGNTTRSLSVSSNPPVPKPRRSSPISQAVAAAASAPTLSSSPTSQQQPPQSADVSGRRSSSLDSGSVSAGLMMMMPRAPGRSTVQSCDIQPRGRCMESACMVSDLTPTQKEYLQQLDTQVQTQQTGSFIDGTKQPSAQRQSSESVVKETQIGAASTSKPKPKPRRSRSDQSVDQTKEQQVVVNARTKCFNV
eukprot:m.12472 g.12472  ORF g.12472 m.12472 type:complete len:1266 (+) comp5828_c0_seq2:324-4121(+)